MEQRIEIKAYAVNKICPKCQIGIMEYTSVVARGFPATYQHKCVKCDYSEFYEDKYPKFTWDEATLDDMPSLIAESKPVPKLNTWEHLFCRLAGEGYIARDDDVTVYWFYEKPTKDHGWRNWQSDGIYLNLDEKPFSKLKFPFIQWSDNEPWSVEELLKLEFEDD